MDAYKQHRDSIYNFIIGLFTPDDYELDRDNEGYTAIFGSYENFKQY